MYTHVHSVLTTLINSTSKHMKTHALPVQCNVCEWKTAENRDMYRHYWASHKRYAERNGIPRDNDACKTCGKAFTRKDNLTKHMKKYRH